MHREGPVVVVGVAGREVYRHRGHQSLSVTEDSISGSPRSSARTTCAELRAHANEDIAATGSKCVVVVHVALNDPPNAVTRRPARADDAVVAIPPPRARGVPFTRRSIESSR